MRPLFFKHLMIVPDTEVLMDAYTVHNYHLFKYPKLDIAKQIELVTSPFFLNQLYLGYISFQDPGKLFTYNAPEELSLNIDDISELINYLTELQQVSGKAAADRCR